MTTVEALLAMKIGCRVTLYNSKRPDAFYCIEDTYICYVLIALGLRSKVCNIGEFIKDFSKMEWKLYDDSTSISGNEAGM
nr:MAG: hypothetical protein [Bacteriophage sp.]